MAKKKTSELTAGIFTVVAILAGLAVVIWLGGSELFKSARTVAFCVPQSVGSMGVLTGSFIRVNDAEVGQIKDVYFDAENKRTVYVGQVGPEIEIHTDGVARVESAFIGSASVVILNPGSPDAPLADERNPLVLTSGGLTAGLNTLSAELDPNRPEALLAKLHVIINRIKDAAAKVADIAENLSSETDRQHLASAIAKIHKSLDDINTMTADARPKVKATLSAVQETAETLRGYTKQDLADVFAKLREITTNVAKIAADFTVVAGQAKDIVLVNRDRIDEIIDNMAITSANLKSTSKEVRRNPWRLLYQPKPGEFESQNLYDAARAFTAGAEQLDEALSKLTGLAKAHPEGLPANDPQLQEIRQHVNRTFENFKKAEDAFWKELTK